MENKLKTHILSVGTLFDADFPRCPGLEVDVWSSKDGVSGDIKTRREWIKSFLLTQAHEQNEVILKMIENLKRRYGIIYADISTENQAEKLVVWNVALDAIAELIKEANRE